jgi:hypothetical protein
MIVCSCNVVTDRDIEEALLEILNRPDAPIPTPGIVYRHLRKRMHCCGCAPVAVDAIYRQVEVLEAKGMISPYVCARARIHLSAFLYFGRVVERRVAYTDACPAALTERA